MTPIGLELCYQDCAVGLLFALLPVLGGGGGVMSGLVSMSRSWVSWTCTEVWCYNWLSDAIWKSVMMFYGYILFNYCWISCCSNIFVKWNTTGMVVAFDVLTFGAFVRLFVLASFLAMAALMARSVVPRFLKLMMHLSSQVANDSTALYDSGREVLP